MSLAEGMGAVILAGDRGADDPVARVLLQRCIFHVVPNMNPDGSVRGSPTNALTSRLMLRRR